MMSASGMQHCEEGLTAQFRDRPAISRGEIAAYCVCSTKLVVQNLEDADVQRLEGGNVARELGAEAAQNWSKTKKARSPLLPSAWYTGDPGMPRTCDLRFWNSLLGRFIAPLWRPPSSPQSITYFIS
jgi:hypothetical protein